MHKIVRLIAAAGVLAIGFHATSAQSDPDLPPVPLPGDPTVGPPCQGTVCLHNWSNVLAVFFEQKQCLKSDGTVLEDAGPFDLNPDCKTLGYLSPGEILPYHKADEHGNWFDDIPVLTQNGPIAVGLQCHDATCGTDPDAPRTVGNGPGDVFWSSQLTVAHAKNNDGGGPGIHVNKDCAGGTVTVASLDDARIFLDKTATQAGVTSGTSELYGQKFRGIRDQFCPPAGYDFENDSWYFALHQFPLKAGQPDQAMSVSLLTLVHSDFEKPQLFNKDGPKDCHLEQEYFLREMGKVRHEAYMNLDCLNASEQAPYLQMNQALVDNPGDCIPLSLEAPRVPGDWLEYGCNAYVRSAPHSGTSDDDPQKAVDILTASNLTYVLFGPLAPADQPHIDSIVPSSIVKRDVTAQLTLHGSFPTSPWFGNNVKVMFSSADAIDTISDLGYASSNNSTVVFNITQKDWDDSGLKCGGNADVRIFDGVSTSNTVPLAITCP